MVEREKNNRLTYLCAIMAIVAIALLCVSLKITNDELEKVKNEFVQYKVEQDEYYLINLNQALKDNSSLIDNIGGMRNIGEKSYKIAKSLTEKNKKRRVITTIGPKVYANNIKLIDITDVVIKASKEME